MAEREHVLSRTHPSSTASIADALVIKSGELYFLCGQDGQVGVGRHHGLGLYARDCRFCDGYELEVAERRLEALASSDEACGEAVLALSTPDLRIDGDVIPRASIGVTWRRALDPARGVLHDEVAFANHGRKAVVLPVALRFSARFEDVFRVRGMTRERPGRRHPPLWDGDVLRFRYEGGDDVLRTLSIRTWPAPAVRYRDGGVVSIALAPGERATLRIELAIGLGDDHAFAGAVGCDPHAGIFELVEVNCDSLLMERVLRRARRDLQALRVVRPAGAFVAAGAPWFVALFGRDSLVTGWQSLAWNPDVAAGALRLLAHHQAHAVDDWRDAEPGKILHELRVGELARTGRIPQTPYYGSVDATPLFLVVLEAHARWTGSLALFTELRDAAEAALAWVLGHLDRYGWLIYAGEAKDGLVNQGWKDSGDAIMRADGSLPTPPIAVVEAQGYAVAAMRAMARLYAAAGEPDRAEPLLARAANLARRIEAAYWDDQLGIHAIALERGGAPCRVASSNPGHLLWTGALSPARAKAVAERLLAEDLWSGWGIRTLSSEATAYNPLGYHLGTVWPHDNSIIAAGLRRYRLDAAAETVVGAVLGAASRNPGYRLPELMSGLTPETLNHPIPYPAACHPQAWGAGSVLSLVQSALGLVADGGALSIERPFLPGAVERLELRGVRIGDRRVDLAFDRHRGAVRVTAPEDVRVVRGRRGR